MFFNKYRCRKKNFDVPPQKMSWSFPPGWSGKLSVSKQRWYYWKENDPNKTVTWHPPSWNALVSSTYNQHLQASSTTELYRSCQNFVKSALLHTWLQFQEEDVVLDVGCGKGGDVFKIPSTVHYFGIDIAEKAILEARVRAKDLPNCSFLNVDFTSEIPLSQQLECDEFLFDKAFSSFAFHYAGEALDTALKSVGSVLQPKGLFLFLVLDPSIETRHPKGFGPLTIHSWEERNVGEKGKAQSSKRVWVSFEGSFTPLPEPILSLEQVYDACKAANFKVLKTELCGSAVSQISDFTDSTESKTLQQTLLQIREKYKSAHLWDSLHWEFTNCYRAWLVEKQ
jgi:SAM-dependent methyltransferase